MRAIGIGIVTVFLALNAVGVTTNYYVATNGSDTGRTGTNGWHDALATIGMAVDKAVNGDRIWVSNGTYLVTAQISVIEALEIRGFSGNPYDTIVNGNYPTTTNACMSVNHTNALVAALTITNGCLFQGTGGGGLSLTAGTVSNCVIAGNRSFVTNTAGIRGGGGINGTVTTTAQLLDSLVADNVASNNGGGIDLWVTGASASFLMRNCTVRANTAVTNVYGYAYGGGANLSGGSGSRLQVEYCSIVSNVSYGRGGGITYSTDSLAGNGIMSHCLVQGNSVIASSSWYGGGVYLSKGTLRNCLILGNSAAGGRGGGVYCATAVTGDKMLDSCTIAGNSSGTMGSGVTVVNNAAPYFRNSIIWGNPGGSAGSSNVWIESGASTNSSFSNCCTAGGGYLLSTISNAVSSGNLTVPPQWGATYRLLRESPCINAGVNQAWMTNALDLDGHARLDRLFQRADMGAFEYVPQGGLMILR